MASAFSLADEFKDPQLEQNFLAAVAATPAIYWEHVGTINGKVFTEGREAIYRALAEAIEAEAPTPAVEGSPVADHTAAAVLLADLYQRRRLAVFAQNVLADLRGDRRAPDLIADFERSLAEVETAFKDAEAGQMKTVETIFPEVLHEVRTLYDHRKATGGTMLGLPTGIKRLDDELGGLQPGLHLLAAEPGTGKTTLTLQIASTVAATGVPAVFVSFEETIKRLALKAVCAKASLNSKRFAEGFGDPYELEEAFGAHSPTLRHLHFISGGADTTVAQVKARALQAMAKAKAAGAAQARCLIVVDYLQTWASTRKQFSDFRHVVGALVAELRDVALKLECPVLVISSQNRGGQNSSRLTSLKESGDLEYCADSAMFLVSNDARFAAHPHRAVDLKLEKNRYGDRDREIPLIFRPDVGTFHLVEDRRG